MVTNADDSIKQSLFEILGSAVARGDDFGSEEHHMDVVRAVVNSALKPATPSVAALTKSILQIWVGNAGGSATKFAQALPGELSLGDRQQLAGIVAQVRHGLVRRGGGGFRDFSGTSGDLIYKQSCGAPDGCHGS